MKTLTYIFTSILACMFIFIASYLIGDRVLNSNNDTKGALVSRFVEPKEIRSFDNLITKLPSERASYPILASDGQSVLYYDQISGNLHSLGATENDYQNQALQRLHPYLKSLEWSPRRNIVIGNDGTNNTYYDLEAGVVKTLPNNVIIPQFDPSGEKIAHINLGSTQTTGEIGISSPDLQSFKKLMAISSLDWSFKWIDPKKLEVSYYDTVKKSISLFILDISTGGLTKFFSGTSDLKTLWAPNGLSLIYSTTENDKTALYYKAAAYSTEIRLPQDIDISRCIWTLDSRAIYCSVSAPDDIDAGDSFISIDVANPLKLRELKMNELYKLKTETLLVSADRQYLFIENSLDSKLYRLKVEFQ